MKKSTLLLLFIFLIFLLISSLNGGYILNKIVITQGPYLQQPSETTMSIMWVTSHKSDGIVEYGKNGYLNKKAMNVRHGLIDANTTLHRVDLKDLEPGTTYSYRITSREILKLWPNFVVFGSTTQSETATFRTLDTTAGSFTFHMVSDIHQDEKLLESLIKGMNLKQGDLMFYNGDMINDFTDENQIFNGFLNMSVKYFAKEIPFIYVRGNHETRGSMARSFSNYFTNKNNSFYYSFSHGPVHFIILDSGEDKEDSNFEYSGLVDFDSYRVQQTEWLKKEIESTDHKDALYRVAIFHMPIYGGNNWHGETHLRKLWAPLFEKGKIDLVLSGHTHKFKVIEPELNRNSYPVIIGSPKTDTKISVSLKSLDIEIKTLNGEVYRTISINPKLP